MKTHGIALLVLALAGCASTRPSTDSDLSSGKEGHESVEKASRIQVVPLKYATANEVADSLSRLLSDSGRTAHADGGTSTHSADRIQVVADQRTNSLVIRCPADRTNEMPDILATIASLDREVKKP